MSIKITNFELENVKRIKAVAYEPSENGLTIIGGNNNQGKTSVLDALAWALGGDRFRPTSAVREGSNVPPTLRCVLSNGLIVERKGKNSELKVIDPSGNKAGQSLLNEFISQFALDVPKFMEASSKEKADILLNVIGIGDKLYELETEEKNVYNRRRFIGQTADQKRKAAAEMTCYPEAPTEFVSASELIRQQQDILARNGENQRKRNNLDEMIRANEQLSQRIASHKAELEDLLRRQEKLSADIADAQKTVQELTDESTHELEENIRNIDDINRKVRNNLDKMKAEEEAKNYSENYDKLTDELDHIRKQKYELLDNADLPLDGLSVTDGELTYHGFRWDNLSGSEQLKVTTAIVRKLNPECGFVLLDKLEQMDRDTLNDFGEWLKSEGLQAIATRVSTGDECSIIIEDGYVKEQPSENTFNFDKWRNS